MPESCNEAKGNIGCCGPDNRIYSWSVKSGVQARKCPDGTACAWVAGRHFLGVATLSSAEGPASYSLSWTLSAMQPCTSAGDCAAEPSTQYLRGPCDQVTGACSFGPADRTLPDGAFCDTNLACASGLCTYSPFANGQGSAHCTYPCAVASVGGGVVPQDGICPTGERCATLGPPVVYCLPKCSSDADCPVVFDQTPVSGPWKHAACLDGVCSF
jgi:hypothetical protein